jgi:hypothetical protein
MVETARRGGARAGVQVAVSLTDMFWAPCGLPLIILPLYDFAENVHPVGGSLETVGDNEGGESDEARSGSIPHAIPWVDFLQDGPDPLGEDTQRSDVEAASAYDLEYREVFDVVFCTCPITPGLDNGEHIRRGIEHAKRGSEGEVADSIEREVNVPWRRRTREGQSASAGSKPGGVDLQGRASYQTRPSLPNHPSHSLLERPFFPPSANLSHCLSSPSAWRRM